MKALFVSETTKIMILSKSNYLTSWFGLSQVTKWFVCTLLRYFHDNFGREKGYTSEICLETIITHAQQLSAYDHWYIATNHNII